MSSTIISGGTFNLSWDSDTKRDLAPCSKCGKPTNGRSKGKAMCLPCAIEAGRNK